jgi:hypothetical protein
MTASRRGRLDIGDRRSSIAGNLLPPPIRVREPTRPFSIFIAFHGKKKGRRTKNPTPRAFIPNPARCRRMPSPRRWFRSPRNQAPSTPWLLFPPRTSPPFTPTLLNRLIVTSPPGDARHPADICALFLRQRENEDGGTVGAAHHAGEEAFDPRAPADGDGYVLPSVNAVGRRA